MMRLLYITLIVVLVGCLTAGAQNTGRGIIIDSLHTHTTGESFGIHFKLKTSGLELPNDGSVKAEFVVEGNGNRLILPSVIYSGKTRYRYEQRRALLAGYYQMEPYHVYKAVKKGVDYRLDYNLHIPYHPWMQHAAISCRLYANGCSGDNLIYSAMLNSGIAQEPEIWRPDSTLYSTLVRFITPRAEEVKARASIISLSIGFPLNGTEVRPEYGTNRDELMRADSLVSSLHGNEFVNIHSVHIRGYASPEGRYSINERLAKGRSEGFKRYLTNKYPGNRHIADASTTWVPEDWEGLARLIENDRTVVQKQEILTIITDDAIASDSKDRLLQNILWWSQNYGRILRDIYPQLRRIELKVDYTVDALTDAQAQKLLHDDPSLLSLSEIYRAANHYAPGSPERLAVYVTAAHTYPDDVTANNNAAAALLRQGRAPEALEFLTKIEGNRVSLINYGVYHYVCGDREKAMEYFILAKEAGIEQAERNIRLIGSQND